MVMSLSPHVDEASGNMEQLQGELAVCLLLSQAPLTNQDPSVCSCTAASVLTSIGMLISAAAVCQGCTLLFKTSGPGAEEAGATASGLQAVRREGCWCWEALE